MSRIHTADYPRQTLANSWRVFVAPAILGVAMGILCGVILSSVYALQGKPIAPAVGWSILFTYVYTAFLFSGSYCCYRESGYYLASIPFSGAARVLFYALSVPVWIPILISSIRMKHGIEELAKCDAEKINDLRLEAREYMGVGFPEHLRSVLAVYCQNQAEASGFQMSEDEAKAIVQRLTECAGVLRLRLEDGYLTLTLKARCVYQGKEYDLGIFWMKLLENGEYVITIARDGRLENEQGVKDSLDDDLLKYLQTYRTAILRQTLSGHIDVAARLVAEKLNDNVCLHQRGENYQVDKHYHQALF